MSELPSHLQGLNPPQQEAVETIEGPLLILAGAGSGKTRVLTRRVAHMLHRGVRPWNILAVTFTNKAAAEMKHRVSELVGEEAGRKLWVSTFHSSCVRILRREAPRLGYSSSFVIYDDDDQKRLLKALLKERNIDIKKTPPNKLRSIIDRAKNRMLSPEQLIDDEHIVASELEVEIFQAYEARLKASNAFDFNDLIGKVVEVWRDHPEALADWQDRFRYIMVDEYQDTNHAQYQLIKLLAGRDRNLAVVGDDDQSIYSFRGADIRNILDFEEDFPDAKVVKLEQNYRSSGRILKAATAVVKNNRKRKDKTLWTAAEEGPQLQMIVGSDEQEEAARVVGNIRSYIDKGYKAEDIAIIYRTNARSSLFEAALQRARLPYAVVGARKFYERREVRDLLAYLKLVVNPSDEMAVMRVVNVPTRGIGAKALGRIQAASRDNGVPLLAATRIAAQAGGRGAKGMLAFADFIEEFQEAALKVSPGELVMTVAKTTGYWAALEAEDTDEAKGRLQNIQRLAEDVQLTEVEPGADSLIKLQTFLDQATLTGQDDAIPDGGKVTLMTAHLAKGLEYPIVFVAGLIEGSFPLLRDDFREEALEEERRLTYVAITRAKEHLILTRAMRRMNYGKGYERTTPSRFLDEIPRELLHGHRSRAAAPKRGAAVPSESRARLDAFLSRHAKPKAKPPSPEPDAPVVTRAPTSADELSPGTRVLHPDLGQGVIRRSGGNPLNPRLTVEFSNHRRTTLFARNSGLEIVEP